MDQRATVMIPTSRATVRWVTGVYIAINGITLAIQTLVATPIYINTAVKMMVMAIIVHVHQVI